MVTITDLCRIRIPEQRGQHLWFAATATALIFAADRYTRYKKGTENFTAWLIGAVRDVKEDHRVPQHRARTAGLYKVQRQISIP